MLQVPVTMSLKALRSPDLQTSWSCHLLAVFPLRRRKYSQGPTLPPHTMQILWLEGPSSAREKLCAFQPLSRLRWKPRPRFRGNPASAVAVTKGRSWGALPFPRSAAAPGQGAIAVTP